MDSGKGVNSGGIKGDVGRESLTPPLNAAIIAALFRAEVQEQKLARRIIGVQFLVILAAAGAAYGWESSPKYAIAVLGGGGASVLNGILQAWRMSRASSNPSCDAHQQLRLMYFYAAERFLAVVTTLGICLAVLKFSPLAVVCGFALGQATLIAARLLLKIETESGAQNVQ